MTQSARDPASHRPHSALEDGPTPAEIPRTLAGGVLSVLPDANPRKLSAWLAEAYAAGAAESEPLLFLILVVGVRLRIAWDEEEAVFESLSTWLTSAPRLMPPALAELVIESLTPELRRAIEHRGWRFGAGGDLVRRQGRPPEARAAWVAALLSENHLATHGVPGPKARILAISLAEVLLGRRTVESSEFYRARKHIGVPDPAPLVAAISGRYEAWLSQHGLQLRDPAPPPEPVDLDIAWRERHRPLAQFVGMYGAERFARLVLQEIPEDLWTPFSNMGDPGVEPGENPDRESAPSSAEQDNDLRSKALRQGPQAEMSPPEQTSLAMRPQEGKD